MKKRCILLAIAFVMLFSVSAYAMAPRGFGDFANLSFNGRTAICQVNIACDSDETIDATISLCRGNVCIADWEESARGLLQVRKTHTVSQSGNYTLIVDFTINGLEQVPLSDSASCT